MPLAKDGSGGRRVRQQEEAMSIRPDRAPRCYALLKHGHLMVDGVVVEGVKGVQLQMRRDGTVRGTIEMDLDVAEEIRDDLESVVGGYHRLWSR